MNLSPTEVIVTCKIYVLWVGGRISWWGVGFPRKLFPPRGGFQGGRISWYTGRLCWYSASTGWYKLVHGGTSIYSPQGAFYEPYYNSVPIYLGL